VDKHFRSCWKKKRVSEGIEGGVKLQEPKENSEKVGGILGEKGIQRGGGGEGNDQGRN